MERIWVHTSVRRENAALNATIAKTKTPFGMTRPLKISGEEILSTFFYYVAIAAQPLMGIVFWSRTWDDSAITLGFARTFALGGKIGPTIGSGIVEGYSTTLWMLLMAAAAKIYSDPHLLLAVAKVSTILLNVLNVVLVKKFVERYQPSVLAALVAGVFGLESITIYESINGMEGPLALALFLLVLLNLRRPGVKAAAIFCAAGALFILTRWEAAWLLFPLLLWERPRKAWIAAAIAWSITFFGSNWERYRYFGSLIPNTIIAKSGPPYSHLSPRAEFSRHVDGITQAGRAVFPLLLILAVLAVFNRAEILRRFGPSFLLFKRHKSLALGYLKDHFDLAMGLSVVLFGAVLALAVGINWGPPNRLVFAVWPVLLYLILLPAWKLAGWKHLRWQFSAVVVLVAIANLALLSAQLARADAPVYMPYTTVDNDSRLATALEEVRAASSRSDLLYAGPDMGGAILFGNHLRVIDTGLLLDPTLARTRYRGFAHYIFDERHPDVIESHLLWTDESGLLGDEALYDQYEVLYVQDIRFFVTRRLLSEIPDSRLVRAAFDSDGRRVLNGSAPEVSKGDLTADDRINQRFRTYFTLVGRSGPVGQGR